MKKQTKKKTTSKPKKAKKKYAAPKLVCHDVLKQLAGYGPIT